MQKGLSMNTYRNPSLIGIRTTMAIKRTMDICLSLAAILVLIPVFIVVSLIIIVDVRANPFFIQTRMGRNNKTFRIVKFRTMRPSTPNLAPSDIQDPDAFITRTGKILRKLSIDELPQVFNIFTGKMSIVGPRPAQPIETELVEYRTRSGASNVRPGLTGLAQINGRDQITIHEKAKMDAFYANNMSLKLDMLIMIKTVGYVLRSEGIHEGAYAEESNEVERSA